MLHEINRVLMVVAGDKAREAAYEITDVLKQAGYSVDLAHVIGEEEDALQTKVYPDVRLTKDMDLGNYKGVVFLDSGGDEGVARVVAKRAGEEEIVVGGYGEGVKVPFTAKLLKDKKLPIGLPEEFYRGADMVRAPAVRCEKLVMSPGNCPSGFALLVVAAMGGRVKKEVESSAQEKALPRSGLVIAPFEEWADFWPLAEKLAETDALLTLADWNDVDIAGKRIGMALAIGPSVKGGVALMHGNFAMPESLWLKQSIREKKEALAVLASSGISDRDPEKSVECSDTERLKIAERELSHQGVWLQDGGMLAMKEGAKIVIRGFEETLKVLKADATWFAKKFEEAHDAGDRSMAAGWAAAICRVIIIGRLVRELRYLNSVREAASKKTVKQADYIFNQSESSEYDYGKGSVPGPYSNVRMPDRGRVIKKYPGDDWLDDLNWMGEQAVANLPRYNPESKCGFYAEFDLWHENDPTSWEDTEKGDTIYKMRSSLQ